MRFKKTKSVVLSLLLCVSGINLAMAEENEWTINFVGTGKPQGEKYYAEYSTDTVYDGSYSLNVVYPDKEKAGSYLEISTTLTGKLESGEYDFRFYMNKERGGCSNNTSKAQIAGETILFKEFTTTELESGDVPSGEEDWICFSAKVNLEETENATVKFVFVGPVVGCYIDEVSLSLSGGDNLISCGGFERVIEKEDIYNPEEYMPTDIMSVPTSTGKIAISWRNPSAETIANIGIYNIENGEAELLSEKFSKTPGDINEYVFEGAEANKEYTFKLLYEYSDIYDIEYFVPAISMSAESNHKIGELGSWTVANYHESEAQPYAFHTAYIDTSEGYDSDASLRLASNSDGYLPGVYSTVTVPVLLHSGKDYQLSFKIKSQNALRNLRVKFPGAEYFTSGVESDGSHISGTKGSYEWKEVVLKKEASENEITSMYFIQDGPSDGIWLDNIELRLLDENGEPTGDNLIADGDFEGLISDKIGAIVDVQATEEDGKISFSWETAGDIDKIRIYQLVGDSWAYRGEVHEAFEGIELTALKYQWDYKFRLVPVNSDGFEGAEYISDCSTSLPDYVIGSPKLYRSGALTTDVTAGGSYTIKSTVKNNIFEDGMSYELLVGVFKDDTLYNLESVEKLVDISSPNAEMTNVTLTVTVPSEDGEYSIKVYQIGSRSDWGVLAPCTIFN